jgi:hypothetical protein
LVTYSLILLALRPEPLGEDKRFCQFGLVAMVAWISQVLRE